MNNVTLSNPPVMEALIDIRCDWAAGRDNKEIESILSECAKSVHAQFPNLEQMFSRTIQFSPSSPDAPNLTIPLFRGFLLRDIPGNRAVQIRRDGLTFSKVQPYQSWVDLIRDTKSLWGSFSPFVGSGQVTRLATRFINKVQIPFPIMDGHSPLPDLPSPLTTPSSFSQLKEFTFRTRSVDTTSASEVILTRIMEAPPEGATSTQMVVDIDVFRIVSGLEPGDPAIWSILETFREVKNRMFYKAVESAILDQYR